MIDAKDKHQETEIISQIIQLYDLKIPYDLHVAVRDDIHAKKEKLMEKAKHAGISMSSLTAQLKEQSQLNEIIETLEKPKPVLSIPGMPLPQDLPIYQPKDSVVKNPLSMTPMHHNNRAKGTQEHPKNWVEGKMPDIPVTETKVRKSDFEKRRK
jgi:hypothetical protein